MAAPEMLGGSGPRLPALDNTNLHTWRVTGVHRLAIAAPGRGLDEPTIEQAITAAFDLNGGYVARGVDGFAALCVAADVVNGADWTWHVLQDESVRQSWHDTLKRRALGKAAADFSRIPFHEREEVLDDVDIYLNRPFELVGNADFGFTDMKVSTWDSPSSWNFVVPRRLKSAAHRHDRWYGKSEQGCMLTSLDEALEFGDAVLERGAEDPRFAESDEAADWQAACRAFESARPTMVEGCRAGSQRERMQVVCAATALVLSWGAASIEIRDGFTDPAGKKLIAWWALWSTCSDTWGRYPRNAVPTDVVLQRVAETVEPDDPDAAFFRAVQGRARDLNGTDRVLHLVIGRVTEALRDAV